MPARPIEIGQNFDAIKVPAGPTSTEFAGK